MPIRIHILQAHEVSRSYLSAPGMHIPASRTLALREIMNIIHDFHVINSLDSMASMAYIAYQAVG
jgi:hypothetical protein